MPRNVVMFDLMLSSPGDVADEREVVENEVAVLNKRLRAQGIAVSTIRWETDTTPAYGGDPQELINEQLPDYGIFVGILWARFGTPTPRAGSGTEEEFLEAQRRWKRDVHGREIMFYFSGAPVPPSVDTGQLARVQRFKDSLGSSALYGTFSSPEEFRRKFSQDVEKVVLRLHKRFQAGGGPQTVRERLKQRFEDLTTRPDTYQVPERVLREIGGPCLLFGVRIELSPEADELCRGYANGKLVDQVNGL